MGGDQFLRVKNRRANEENSVSTDSFSSRSDDDRPVRNSGGKPRQNGSIAASVASELASDLASDLESLGASSLESAAHATPIRDESGRLRAPRSLPLVNPRGRRSAMRQPQQHDESVIEVDE